MSSHIILANVYMHLYFHHRAIYFSVYSKVKRNLKTSKIVKKDSVVIPLFAGAAAGMCI